MNTTQNTLLKSATLAVALLGSQAASAEPAGQAATVGPAISAAGLLSAGTLEQEQRADHDAHERSPAQEQREQRRALKRQMLDLAAPLINVYP